MDVVVEGIAEICKEAAERESDAREQLQAILPRLSVDQLRYIVARQECTTDSEAARQVGLSASRVYHWPAYVKRAAELMAEDCVAVALRIRGERVAKAMTVKVALLDSHDERVRSAAATDIIEGELGKPRQATDVRLNAGLDVYLKALRRVQAALAGDGDEEVSPELSEAP